MMKRVKEFSKNAYRISSSHKIHHCDNVVALEEKKKKRLKITALTLFCSYGTDGMRYEAMLLSIYIQLADIYSFCTCVLP